MYQGSRTPSFNKVRGGIKAKQYGSGFEDVFDKLCKFQGVAISRIPDGCKQIGPNPRRDLIRVTSPFDWVLTYQGKTVLVDTKTMDSSLFSNSLIKQHQVDEMLAHERSGGKGGYVIWLRESGHVFYLDARFLAELMRTRGSFNETHPSAVQLGKDYNFDVRKIFGEDLPTP